ncbi:DNA starvation/stationary phase protection protein [Erysipelothrix inopinata]|uniref:DNA starvation/stationary phase protection protein n=1 Tax=Erysipelothrix inopinata TaxID=225084 RepID=A0A7G9RZE8_9FIRM|nr:DNA starvation/stationary phase protection protein [Erysipelothrix inopinata]QNN60973.1 DNA starvation/stationary phase protection protein [Erysipelothrix inopinata]
MNSLYEEMNTFLADQLVLSMKIHNIHWFMKGQGFFPIHEKMDDYYDEAQERIDAVAERLLTIGAKPIGNLKEVTERSSIEELGNDYITAVDGFKKLIVDFEHMNQLALHIVKLAEELGDPGTADYFTGVSQDLGKDLWMMNAYIK